MANKSKQTEGKKQTAETWRKPLQVPPRTDAMRSFYQGDEEKPTKNIKKKKPKVMPPKKNKSAKVIQKESVRSSTKKENNSNVKTETKREVSTSQIDKTVSRSKAENSDKLTKEELSEQLGFEAGDLFDVHELLRGKSFDIYQNLLQSCDETGRCKITQPELMNRTGIKNRRTFYKHEERLINLKLLEKRHRPGDHKGIVYSVFELGDILPLSTEMLEQFTARVKEDS
jgi:hypothetical protein